MVGGLEACWAALDVGEGHGLGGVDAEVEGAMGGGFSVVSPGDGFREEHGDDEGGGAMRAGGRGECGKVQGPGPESVGEKVE